ncbi:hypothetical protein SS1G_12476 [Sclerotinia sclerotiorum 1980 UF-70]|uniref:Uncharacterized protein n=1 Tax=Sclerotinia sclerotiorum (strain ATCC 18683 / 1980 / Ss-1) TaxID=665079 RepID=A7F4F1_SCLS1|nr:hypothetical protein SS1G_12476 [Sclerotinia sclerotiorum 1980 UF-70]EDN97622.1 hypothetical protein SS1G_12476 [Sclerotinia sclerotiorum 1980 UF-70]
MARIFPNNELSAAQLVAATPFTRWETPDNESPMNHTPFRRARLGSVPMEGDISEQMSDLSFGEENSRIISPHFNVDGPIDSCSELATPIPGYGGAPPIIPVGTGGAARATAAAQNLFKNHQFLTSEDAQQNDRESAIGIAISSGLSQWNFLFKYWLIWIIALYFESNWFLANGHLWQDHNMFGVKLS